MARRTAHPSRRVSPLALVVTLVSIVLAGWAVRGLLQDPVPSASDFGPSTVTVDSPPSTPDRSGPAPAAHGPAATSPPSRRALTAAAGSPLPEPGRSSAALPTVEPRPEPVRLTVPRVGLEVSLDAVGVAPDGQMEIPEQADRAGWYRHGPAPGDDMGSVVVAAHVDTTTGPGAFLALTDVSEGDEVVVELADGTSTAYRIVGGEQVAKTDLAVDELFRRDGEPALRLITCTGDWSPRTGHYTDNLVVTAVPLG